MHEWEGSGDKTMLQRELGYLLELPCHHLGVYCSTKVQENQSCSSADWPHHSVHAEAQMSSFYKHECWLNWSELILMRHSGQISVCICYFFYPLVFMAFSPTFKALIRTGFCQESWIFRHENGHTSPHYILYIVGLGHFLCNFKPVAAVRLKERKIHPLITGFSSSVWFDSFSTDFHQIVLLTASKCIPSGLWEIIQYFTELWQQLERKKIKILMWISRKTLS